MLNSRLHHTEDDRAHCQHMNMQAHCERSVGMVIGLVLLGLASTGATARVKTDTQPHLFFMLADDLVRTIGLVQKMSCDRFTHH